MRRRRTIACCPRKLMGYRVHGPDCVVGRLLAAGQDAIITHRDVKPDIIDAERAEWRRVWFGGDK